MVAEKFLGIIGARRNSVFFSQIHSGAHNKFNEWTPLTVNMRRENIIFCTLIIPKNCSWKPT